MNRGGALALHLRQSLWSPSVTQLKMWGVSRGLEWTGVRGSGKSERQGRSHPLGGFSSQMSTGACERHWAGWGEQDQLPDDTGLEKRIEHTMGEVWRVAWLFLLMAREPPFRENAKCVPSPGTGKGSLWLMGEWQKKAPYSEGEAGNCWVHDPISYTTRKAGNLLLNKNQQMLKAEMGCKRGKSKPTEVLPLRLRCAKSARGEGPTRTTPARSQNLPHWSTERKL